MPPDPQLLSNPSTLTTLSGAGSIASGFSGGLMSVRTPGQTVIGILTSRTAQDSIINRFDLRRIDHCKFYLDARGKLTKQTAIAENNKTGIVSITVTDRDPYLARDLAKAYVDELDNLLNTVSTSSARRERIFLEERIKSVKSDLDASSRELSQFSSRNATLNPQSQGQALFESATRLQGELITAQSELSGLKAMYSDDNVRVRESRARVDELQSQLRKMGNVGEKADGSDQKSDQLYPSIRELPILGVTYSDLFRQLSMQEGIYETLTKQYELAKVEEAKEIPVIKVLDEPQVPERKSSPHRSIITILGAIVAAFAGIMWIIACKLWEITDDSHPAKAIAMELIRTIKGCDAATPD
jgi:capsule polysaccharide export protein KpsE/RkpR